MNSTEPSNESRFFDSVIGIEAETSKLTDNNSFCFDTYIKHAPTASSTPIGHNVHFAKRQVVKPKRSLNNFYQSVTSKKVCASLEGLNPVSFDSTFNDVNTTSEESETSDVKELYSANKTYDTVDQTNGTTLTSDIGAHNCSFSEEETLLNYSSNEKQQQVSFKRIVTTEHNKNDDTGDATATNFPCFDSSNSLISEDSVVKSKTPIRRVVQKKCKVLSRAITLQYYMKSRWNSQQRRYPRWLENAKNTCTHRQLLELMNSIYESRSSYCPQDLSTCNYESTVAVSGKEQYVVEDFYDAPTSFKKRFSSVQPLYR